MRSITELTEKGGTDLATKVRPSFLIDSRHNHHGDEHGHDDKAGQDIQ